MSEGQSESSGKEGEMPKTVDVTVHVADMEPMKKMFAAYLELREIAQEVRHGSDALFSSLPFQPPEAYSFQINAKIAGPLNDLAEWLDAHPDPPEVTGDG